MSSSSPFGPTFRKIREARGLSLKEVAQILSLLSSSANLSALKKE